MPYDRQVGIFLGVDGGQSRTTALIGDDEGRVLGMGRGGPCNHVSGDVAQARFVGAIGDAMPVKMNGAILFAPAGELVPVALQSLARGGTLALAGIYMSPVPPLDYARDLFYERTVRSVTANTRADGEELLTEAARIPIRTATTTFPLEDANRALNLLKRGEFAGAGVLLTGQGSRV